MIDIDRLTEEEFRALPLVVEGNSKEVRYGGNGLVVIRFKPTIYSFTYNRAGVVPFRCYSTTCSKILVECYARRVSEHAYREVNDRGFLLI